MCTCLPGRRMTRKCPHPAVVWILGHSSLMSPEWALAISGLAEVQSPSSNPCTLDFGAAVGGFPQALARQAGCGEDICGEAYPLPLHH